MWEDKSELTLVKLLVYFSTNWWVNLAASLPQILRAAFSEQSVSSVMELKCGSTINKHKLKLAKGVFTIEQQVLYDFACNNWTYTTRNSISLLAWAQTQLKLNQQTSLNELN